jgi:hypothetical protein
MVGHGDCRQQCPHHCFGCSGSLRRTWDPSLGQEVMLCRDCGRRPAGSTAQGQ